MRNVKLLAWLAVVGGVLHVEKGFGVSYLTGLIPSNPQFAMILYIAAGASIVYLAWQDLL